MTRAERIDAAVRLTVHTLAGQQCVRDRVILKHVASDFEKGDAISMRLFGRCVHETYASLFA